MYGISIGHCAICQEPINSSKARGASQSSQRSASWDVASALGCGHIFHMECAEKLTPPENSENIVCPICRHPHKSKLVPLIANATEYKLETPKSLTSLMEELALTATKISTLAQDAKTLGETGTTCEYCDKRFDEWPDFVKHFRSEHSRIKCDMCPEWFDTTADYRRHFKTVHEEFPCQHWQCTYSGEAATFRTLEALIEHSRRMHPMEIETSPVEERQADQQVPQQPARAASRRRLQVPATVRVERVSGQSQQSAAGRALARRTRSSPGTYGFANRDRGRSAHNDRHVYVEAEDSDEFALYDDEFDGDSQNAELLCEICCIYFRNKSEMDMHALGMHDIGDAADAWGEEDWRCAHPGCEDRAAFRSEKAFCQHFSAKHVSFL